MKLFILFIAGLFTLPLVSAELFNEDYSEFPYTRETEAPKGKVFIFQNYTTTCMSKNVPFLESVWKSLGLSMEKNQGYVASVGKLCEEDEDDSASLTEQDTVYLIISDASDNASFTEGLSCSHSEAVEKKRPSYVFYKVNMQYNGYADFLPHTLWDLDGTYIDPEERAISLQESVRRVVYDQFLRDQNLPLLSEEWKAGCQDAWSDFYPTHAPLLNNKNYTTMQMIKQRIEESEESTDGSAYVENRSFYFVPYSTGFSEEVDGGGEEEPLMGNTEKLKQIFVEEEKGLHLRVIPFSVLKGFRFVAQAMMDAVIKDFFANNNGKAVRASSCAPVRGGIIVDYALKFLVAALAENNEELSFFMNSDGLCVEFNQRAEEAYVPVLSDPDAAFDKLYARISEGMLIF
ncbi:MAG: hypothetical protein OXC30_05610 [Alphaproteobacteria bacterium]|nr:hypothetical protein [Alphaproteobacteria bacterium]